MKKFKSLALLAGLVFSGLAYAGEFDNNCTNGLSKQTFHKTKCEINEIFNGKTYCFSTEGGRDSFLFDPQDMITKAENFYAKNANMPMAQKADNNGEIAREKISQADALKQINSKTCDLSNKDAGYLIFNGMNLSHCNMQNVSFFGAELMGANLSGANLQKSYLNLARLENANLSGANLTDATIFQAIFDKTNFQGANLTNARMIGTLGNVNMSDATIVKGRFGLDIGNQPMGAMRFDAIGGKFANTNFEGADINRSNFKFADFRGANLRNTDLFRADFSKADLTGADITGANMGEAVLDETIMTNVKGLEAIKGYLEAKGKCIDCTIIAAAPQAKEAATTNLMIAENPAMKVCNVRGARF
ncbi:MAG: pentapeptide repeat-containing protein [Methylotenera sp.]|nr:pentapeptide repeat-containing protein [Methylotenera sp.]NOT66524.1 pentapeptide repeat-containing protein [Methylotenera sp.]